MVDIPLGVGPRVRLTTNSGRPLFIAITLLFFLCFYGTYGKLIIERSLMVVMRLIGWLLGSNQPIVRFLRTAVRMFFAI